MNKNFMIEELCMEDLLHANPLGAEVHYADQNVALLNNLRNFSNRAIRMSAELSMLLFCREGKVDFTLNENTDTLSPSKLVFLGSKSVIRIGQAGPDCVCAAICISTRFIQAVFHRANDLFGKFLYLREHPVIRINDEWKDLFTPYSQIISVRLRNPGRAYHQEAITCAIVGMLYELLADLPDVFLHKMEKNTIRQGDILFRRFTKLLADDNVKSRHVAFYANELCVTPKYLSAVCSKVSGRTASEWISDTVTERIRYLLAHTDKSIKEISEYLEFPNLSFFCKYVKNSLGCPPKEYRDRLR